MTRYLVRIYTIDDCEDCCRNPYLEESYEEYEVDASTVEYITEMCAEDSYD